VARRARRHRHSVRAAGAEAGDFCAALPGHGAVCELVGVCGAGAGEEGAACCWGFDGDYVSFSFFFFPLWLMGGLGEERMR
jgi:hypothetical protein